MSKRYTLLLSFTLALFLCLFLMLTYFSRLATDDYFFIWDVRTNGLIKGVTSQYFEWCGRFAATFAMDLFYALFDVDHHPYQLLCIASLLLLFSGLFYLFGSVSDFSGFYLKRLEKILMAGCFSALLFFLSLDIGESWFWFCGLSSYLWSIIAFIWGLAFLYDRKKDLFTGMAAATCFIYIGGASEVYSSFFGLLLAIILYTRYKKNETLSLFISNPFNKKLVMVSVFLAISFIVFLVAPGNYLRDGLFPERRFFYSFFITAKSFVKFGALYLPFKILCITAFALPFSFFGNALRQRSPEIFKLPFHSFFKRLSIWFLSFLFLFFFLVAYVMVETGPARIWFLVSFILAIYCALLFFYAGYKSIIPASNHKTLGWVGIGAGIILTLSSLFGQYRVASRYAAAVDQRIDRILELNTELKSDTLITIDPLPPSGMLYSAEISADTSHFTNKELRLGYNLNYHVITQKLRSAAE